MSTTIDEKVVSLQFDNSQFERNVRTSMSTLDKLKSAFKMDGVSKSLDNVQKSVNGLDFEKVEIAAYRSGFHIQDVWLKLSSVFEYQIANKIQSSLTSLAKAFTIDPIQSGLSEYELKMNSVQTIMAGTGESVETVNKYLNELNAYSDETIYSFQDMTANIGKFTNAGVKLEDAVLAIKGVSNEAAVSGANANEASRAMYNFAQALSAGYVKLIDWKSIENANMATLEFKNQLIETAVKVGTLTKTADGMYNTGKRNITGVLNFNDSLQDQWMTTEVLIGTLKDYADKNTEIGQKAFEAATKVKTFTQMMDVLKETAQSGWAQTWELIFGNLEEAKAMFTPLTDFFSGIIDTFSSARNNLLENVLGKDSAVSSFVEKFDKLKDKILGVTRSVEEYEEVVNRVLRGEYGDEETRWSKLAEEGYDWARVQNLINKLYGDSTHYTEQLTDANIDLTESIDNMSDAELRASGFTEDEINLLRNLAQESKQTNVPLADLVKNLDAMSGRAKLLKGFANYGKAFFAVLHQIRLAWEELFPAASDNLANGLKNAIDSFYKFSNTLVQNGKATNKFKESLDKIKRAIKGVLSVLDIARSIVNFGLTVAVKTLCTLLGIAGGTVLDMAAAIGDVLVEFRDWIHNSNLLNTITNVLAVSLSIIFSIIVSVCGAIVDIVKAVGRLPIVSTIINKISKAFTKFHDTAKNAIEKVKGYFENFEIPIFGERIEQIVNFFDDLFTKITNNKTVASILDSISSAFDKFVDKLKNFELPKSNLSGLFDFFAGIGKNVSEHIKNSEALSFVADAISGAFERLKEAFLKIKDFKFELPKIDWKKFANFGKYLDANNLKGITGFSKGLIGFTKQQMSWSFADFKSNIIVAFSEFWTKYSDKLISGFKKAKEVIKAFAQFIVGSEEITLPDILELVRKILEIKVLYSALTILENITGSFESIGEAAENFAKAFKWKAIGQAFKSMAIALAALSLCIVVIAQIKDPEAAIQSAIIVGSLLAVMGGIAIALTALCKNIESAPALLSGTASMIMLAGSLAILVATLKAIDTTDFNSFGKSFGILMGILTTLVFSIVAIGKTCGGATFRSAAAILTLLAAVKMVPDILQDFSEFPWSSYKKSIVMFGEVLLGLALVLRVATGSIKEGANTAGLSLLIISMMVSVKMLMSTIKEFGDMPIENMKQGITGIVSIMLAMTIMLAVINKTNKGGVLEKGQRSINNFTGLAAALLAVSASIYILGKMDLGTLKQGGAAIVTILGMFALIFASMGKVGTVKTGRIMVSIIGLGVIIAGLFYVTKELAKTNWENSVGAAAALSALLIALSGCSIALSKFGKVNWNIAGTLAAVLGLGVIAAGLVYHVIKPMASINPTAAIGQVGALSALIIALTGVEIALAKFGAINSNSGKAIVALFAISFIAGLLVEVIKGMDGVDPTAAIGQVAALSTLLLSLSTCLLICQKVGVLGSAALEGLKILAIAIGGLALIVAAAGGLMQIPGCEKLMNDGVAFMTTLGKAIGGFVGAILEGVLAGINAGICSFLPILGDALTSFSKNAEGFFEWINGLDWSIMGKAAVLTGVLTLLLGLELIDGLFSISSSLPVLGENLGKFMTTAKPFFDQVTQIDESAARGAQALADAILAISAAGVMDAITSWLTGSSSIETFGPSLAKFGEGLVGYTETISGLDEGDIAKIETSAKAAEKLAEMSDSLPKEGGWVQTLLGQANMQTFGERLASFGNSLIAYRDSIADLTEADVKQIEISAKAGTALADLASALPNEGGVLAILAGENNIDDFGKRLAPFGKSLVAYARSIDGLQEGDGQKISDSAMAAEGIVKVADAIPNSGGLGEFFAGNNDIDMFGYKLAKFGKSLAQYAESVRELTNTDVGKIELSKSAIEAMVEAAKAIPRDGGVAGFFAGDRDFEGFGNGMVKLAYGLFAYVTTARNIKKSDVEAIKISKDAMSALADVAGEVPNVVNTWTGGIKDYSGFSKGMSDLVKNLINYIIEAKKITDADIEAIDRSKEAIKAVSSAAKSIPNDGGVAGFFAGENNASNFVKPMLDMIVGLLNYVSYAKGLTDDDIANIDRSKKAIKAISSAAKSIPNDGGVAGFFAGENNASDFVKPMTDMILGLQKYAFYAKDITDEDITNIDRTKNAFTAITSAASTIPGSRVVTEDYSNSFTNGMVNFIQGVINYKNKASELGEDAEAKIESAKDAIRSFIETVELVQGLSFKGGDIASMVYGFDQFIGVIKELSTIDSGALNGVSEALRNLGSGSITAFIDEIQNGASKAESAMVELVNGMLNAIESKSSSIAKAFGNTLDSSLKTINNKFKTFNNVGTKLVKELADGIKKNKSKATNAIKTVVSDAADAADDNKSDFETAGASVVEGFAKGITSNTYQAEAAASAMAQASYEAAKKKLDINSPSKLFRRMASCVPEGFAAGITNNVGYVKEASVNMAEIAEQTVRKALKINSPSKVFIKIGSGIPEGMNEGILDGTKSVIASVKELCNRVTNTAQGEMSRSIRGSDYLESFDGWVESQKEKLGYLGDLFQTYVDKYVTIEGKSWVDGKSLEDASEMVKKFAESLYLESDAYKTAKESAQTNLDNIEEYSKLRERNTRNLAVELGLYEDYTNGVVDVITVAKSELAEINAIEDTLSETESNRKSMLETYINNENSYVNSISKETSAYRSNITTIEENKKVLEELEQQSESLKEQRVKAYEEFDAAEKKENARLEKVNSELERLTANGEDLTVQLEKATEATKESGSLLDKWNETAHDMGLEIHASEEAISLYENTVGKLTNKTEKITEATVDETEAIQNSIIANNAAIAAAEAKLEVSEEYITAQNKVNDLENAIIQNELERLNITDKLNDQQEAYNEAMIKNFNEAYDISGKITELLDPFNASSDNRVGNLFEEFTSVDTDDLKAPRDILDAMQSQVEGVLKWQADLAELSGKGISEGLLGYIKDLGPTAVNEIQAFMQMTSDELQIANTWFAAQQKMSGTALLESYKEQAIVAEEWADNIERVVEAGFDEDLVKEIIDKGVEEGNSFMEALLSMDDKEIAEFNEARKKALTIPEEVATSVYASLMQSGSESAMSYRNGLTTLLDSVETKDKIKTTVESTSSQAIDAALESVYDDGYRAGSYQVEGYVDGVMDRLSDIEAAAEEMINTSDSAVRAYAEINSPSKRFARLASWIPAGFAKGIEDNLGDIKEASTDLASVAYSSTKDAMLMVADVINSDDTVKPTIRPVVDMNGLDGSTVKLSANINTYIGKPVDSLSKVIADAQSEIYASNDKVVTAIAGLREELNAFYSGDDQEIALYVDSKKLATSLAKPMNRQLNILSRRGINA